MEMDKRRYPNASIIFGWAQMNDRKSLSMWAVYAHPTDFPDHFVARLFIVNKSSPKPTDKIIVADSINRLREYMPPNLHVVPRHEYDDPKIIEIWM